IPIPLASTLAVLRAASSVMMPLLPSGVALETVSSRARFPSGLVATTDRRRARAPGGDKRHEIFTFSWLHGDGSEEGGRLRAVVPDTMAYLPQECPGS